MKKRLLPLIVLAAAQPGQAQTLPKETADKLTTSTMTFLAERAQKAQTPLAADEQAGDSFHAFVTVEEGKVHEALESIHALGITTSGVSGNVIIATLTDKQVAPLAALPEVKSIQAENKVHVLMDKARRYGNADLAHTDNNALGHAYKGNGVVVGIVDFGFEYGHVNFRDSSGALRVKRVWNQSKGGGTAPEGYSYGAEYATEADILAAKYDTDLIYHGTHVAGIAAGSDMARAYYGVAPEADLVFVSYSSDTEVADAVKYIFDYAKSVGKPAVVNLSLGGHDGPHDGTSAIDRFFDSAAGEGAIIVGSVGNEGNRRIHARKTFTATDNTMECGIDFGYVMRDDSETDPAIGSRGTTLNIWSNPGKRVKAKIIFFDKETGETLYTSPEVDSQGDNKVTETIRFDRETDGATGMIYLAAGVDGVNMCDNVRIPISLQALETNIKVGVIVTGEEGATVDMWTGWDKAALTADYDGWTAGDSQHTMGEIGGTGKSTISVGSYHSRTKYATISGYDLPTEGDNLIDLPDGSLSPFSSKGDTRDGRMKPDVSAPGWYVVSSVSKYAEDFNPLEAVSFTEYNGEYYYYGAEGGTSMSSPFVAGSIALWLEACPTLTPSDVRDILKETAVHDEYTVSGVNDWGYGKIDTYAGLAAAVKKQTGIARVPGSDIQPRAYVSQASGRLTVTFRQDQGATAATLFNAQGAKLATASIPATTTGTTLTLGTATLTPGVYLVRVTSEQRQPQTFKVSIK